MGQGSSGSRLQAATDRAADGLGKIAVSARYKKLPKKLEDDYVVEGKVLGTGYNGSVFLAKSKHSDGRYAVKGFHLHGVPKDKMEQLESECQIFLSMDHPHVARLVDVYESSSYLHLVMECMEGGELFERLKKRARFSERDAAQAVWQMLLAVNYLHNRGIVHRDLKLENFLYEKEDTDHLKLIDFGFSHIWEPNTKMALSCGTLAYVAPEVLGRSYTSKCDLWSLGVILFILLAGYMPFSGGERVQRKAIEDGKYMWLNERWKGVSVEAIDLVKKLLTKDSAQRFSADQALAHPFIEKRHAAGDQQPLDLVDQSAADALVNFAKASQFRRACMSVMAWSLTNEERTKVRDIFIAMDKNKKGTITLYELKEVLTTKFKIADEHIKPIFEALDTAANDEIHYSEFLAAMVSTRIGMHDDLLTQTFQRFDVDNSGYITIENLRVVLGESFDGAEIEKLMQEADTTKDGRLSYPEFIQYLKGSGDEHAAEVAEKIIETELHKDQAPALGTLAWAKKKSEGLLAVGTGSKTVVEPLVSSASLASTNSLQVSTSSTQVPPKQPDTKQPPAPEVKEVKEVKGSRTCVLL